MPQGTPVSAQTMATPTSDFQTSLPESLPLWPGRPPLPVEPAASPRADWPDLTIFRPAPSEANGGAMVVLQGGGYQMLAGDYEGATVARWLCAQGFTSAVLRYRHAPYTYPVPLADLQRAIRLVRSRSAEYQLIPGALGVIGFSAGGHLASMSGTIPALELPGAPDAIDAESARPDFLVLCYPVIAMAGAGVHVKSAENLTGSAKASDPLRKELSTHLRVTPETPPTFLYHCGEDDVVPPLHSLLFYRALMEKGVPAELHIFEKGRHGGGLGADGRHPWGEMCQRFLKRRMLAARAAWELQQEAEED